MKNSKFNKLFKMVMQSVYPDSYDNTEAYGRTAYRTNEFNKENDSMQAKVDGQPVIDPSDGQPVYWELMAAHYPGFDMITRQQFPKYTTVFSYKPCKIGSDKARKYVTLNTYENATPQQQTKLQLAGLNPGFKYDLAMEDAEGFNETRLRKSEFRFSRRGNGFTKTQNQLEFSLPQDKIEQFISILKNSEIVKQYETLYDDIMNNIGTKYYPNELQEENYTVMDISIIRDVNGQTGIDTNIFKLAIPYSEVNQFNRIFDELLNSLR